MFAFTQHELNCLDDGGRGAALELLDSGQARII